LSETITFYGAPLSGNAYKVRLFLSLLGLDFQEVDVDLEKGETRGESFLRILLSFGASMSQNHSVTPNPQLVSWLLTGNNLYS